MKALTFNQTKQWLKTSHHPCVKVMFTYVKKLINIELPAPKFILRHLYSGYQIIQTLCINLTRIMFWTPLFKGRLENVGNHLYLHGGLPSISGPIRLFIGNNCRISGLSTFSGRSCAKTAPILLLGNNIDIGWMTTIAVGTRIEIGDNVRIAGRALLAGYPGHPMDPKTRALGHPETDQQVGNIIIEKDVWLATGVSVMPGVCIGHGTIVAAGSIVTHDLPPMVLAAGIPATVMRSLTTKDLNHNGDK